MLPALLACRRVINSRLLIRQTILPPSSASPSCFYSSMVNHPPPPVPPPYSPGSIRDKSRDYIRKQRERIRQWTPPTKARIKAMRALMKERISDVKDNMLTIPNGLCVIRIGATPLIGYLVVVESFMPACVLFAIAGFTDLLDGWIARRFPTQKSMLGSVLDPVADKFLISTLFVTLTYSGLIPVWLTSIVLLRDSVLIFGSFVRRYQLLEAPRTLSRFFDPNVSSVKVTPSMVSKVNTVLQLSLVTLSLASPVFGFVDHPILTALCIATAGTTIYSGLQYAQRNAMIPVKRSMSLPKKWKLSLPRKWRRK